MHILQPLVGFLFLALGAFLLFTAPVDKSIAPVVEAAKPQREEYTPPVLPPIGAAIGAQRNEVWESRDGSLFDISAPIRGNLMGHSKPKVIDEERGWTMSRMMEWRIDGVATSGETELDLVKRRDDLQPYLKFDEDGYVRAP